MNDTDSGYAADGGWAFDDEVARVFDDMLARSIPQYEVMRAACTSLAIRYQQEHTGIIDLGCSRGEAVQPLIDKFGAHNHFVCTDVSQPMLDCCRERWKGYIDAGVVEVRDMDLRTEYPPVNASVTLAILTIQFTPIEHRQRILRNIWERTVHGGALIMVEKVLGNSADLDTSMVKIYYDMKAENGYSQDQIERKRLSLEGVLVPVTAQWNEEMLRTAGFSHIDCFWRWMNFAGWIAVKD